MPVWCRTPPAGQRVRCRPGTTCGRCRTENLVDELWNAASDPAPGAVVLDLDAVADAVTLEQQDAYVRLP